MMKIEGVVPQTYSPVPKSGNGCGEEKVEGTISGAGKAEIGISGSVQVPPAANLTGVLSPEEKTMLATLFGSYQQSSVSYDLQAQPVKQVEIGQKIDTTA